MARSDDPFKAACVAMPARTLWPAMFVAFMPALIAAVLKIAAIESRCKPVGATWP
jgi:hypothetical protein